MSQSTATIQVGDYLAYLIFAVALCGGLAVAGSFFYGCYVLLGESVGGGLLILGRAAAGASLLYLATVALLAAAAAIARRAQWILGVMAPTAAE